MSLGGLVDQDVVGGTIVARGCSHGSEIGSVCAQCWNEQNLSTADSDTCIHGTTRTEGMPITCSYCLNPEHDRCGCGGSVGSVTRHQEGSATPRDTAAAESMFWCAIARHGFYTGNHCPLCHPKVELPMPVQWGGIAGFAVGLTSPIGWQCPKCGRVWGPQVEGCVECNDETSACLNCDLIKQAAMEVDNNDS